MIERFVEEIKGQSLSVVLPEGRDERVVAAARQMKDQGIAEPIVLGSAVYSGRWRRDARALLRRYHWTVWLTIPSRA